MSAPRVAYISIPRGLASQAVTSNRELKAYAVFYQLKSLYVGGVIFHFRSRLADIARSFGYGERKLRTYLKLLQERGLVEVQARHHLVLRASRVLAQAEGVAEKTYWRVDVRHLPYLETVLRALALEENLLKQRYSLKKRVVEDIIATHVGIPNPATTLQPARYQQLRRRVAPSVEQAQHEAQLRYTSEVECLRLPAGGSAFPWATLSRQGIARVLNRKSKATGQRYAQKLRALGLLTEQAHRVGIGEFSYEQYQQLQKSVLGYDPTYQFKNGRVEKVLPNQLTLVALS